MANAASPPARVSLETLPVNGPRLFGLLATYARAKVAEPDGDIQSATQILEVVHARYELEAELGRYGALIEMHLGNSESVATAYEIPVRIRTGDEERGVAIVVGAQHAIGFIKQAGLDLEHQTAATAIATDISSRALAIANGQSGRIIRAGFNRRSAEVVAELTQGI